MEPFHSLQAERVAFASMVCELLVQTPIPEKSFANRRSKRGFAQLMECYQSSLVKVVPTLIPSSWFDLPRDDVSPRMEEAEEGEDSQVDRIFAESGVPEYLLRILDSNCAKPSRVWRLLSRLLENNASRAILILPFLDRLFDVLSQRGPFNVDNRAAVFFAARCIANAAYQSVELQQDLTSRGFQAILSATLGAQTTPAHVLMLLQAFLNVSYHINPFPINPDQLLGMLKPIEKCLVKFSMSHFLQLGHLCSVLFYRSGTDHKSDWTRALRAIAKMACGPVAKRGLKMLNERDVGALSPMVHVIGGDALAANFFRCASVVEGCLDAWTQLFWLGKLKMAQDLPYSTVDFLCSGLSAAEVAGIDERKKYNLNVDGPVSYLLFRYARHLTPPNKKKMRRSPIFNRVFKEKFLAWAEGQGSVSAEETKEWFTDHITAADYFFRPWTASISEEVQRAARESYEKESAQFIEKPRSCTLITCKSRKDVDDMKLAQKALAKANIHAPNTNRKRWYHGCYGYKALCMLKYGLRNSAVATAQDLGTCAVYFFETFEHALWHARSRYDETRNGIGFPADVPTVVIFEVDEEKLRSYPHLFISDAALFKSVTFSCRYLFYDYGFFERLRDPQALICWLEAALQCCGSKIPQRKEHDITTIGNLIKSVRDMISSKCWVFSWMSSNERRNIEQIGSYFEESDEQEDADDQKDNDEGDGDDSERNLEVSKSARWARALQPPDVLGVQAQIPFCNTNRSCPLASVTAATTPAFLPPTSASFLPQWPTPTRRTPLRWWIIESLLVNSQFSAPTNAAMRIPTRTPTTNTAMRI